MNRLLKMILLVLLFLMLVLSGFFFFVFSQTGNAMLKPYVKQKLEEKIGMPVKVSHFRLESGKSSLDFIVNEQAVVNVVTHYDLFGGSFEGIYRIQADRFQYEEVQFKNADLKGNFKGKTEDLSIDGQGTLLGGEISYSFNLLDDVAHKIVLTMKEAQLAALLQINGYPALAEGKIDIDINMPDIGETTASGDGHIVLKKATFNRQLVQELYRYTLPENAYVVGAIDAVLDGKNIQLLGEVQSDLFTLKIKDGQIDTTSKKMRAAYSMDVKEMRILTRNKLAGPFKLDGDIQREGKKTSLTGESNSLGGTLHIAVQEAVKLTLEKLSLERLLPFLKVPDHAKGEVSGSIILADEDRGSGSFDLSIDKGILKSRAIQTLSRYNIPEENTFSVKAKGEIAKKQLIGDLTLKSTLADAVFTSVVYDTEKKRVASEYDLLVHDVNLLIPKAKSVKGDPVRAQGSLIYKDRLNISGIMKGMGEKVAFSYDSEKLNIDASKLLVEKILALTATPLYVKGAMDAKVDFTSLDPNQGRFELEGDTLVTNPQEMQKLTGEALEVPVALQSSGTFHQGVGNIDTKIKSALVNVSLPDMVYDTKKKSIQSSYAIDIPQLEKLHKVIDRKLYGPLLLKGVFTQDKQMNLTGSTQTLGGNIVYRLAGNHLTSTIENVPLENILGLLGHRKDFLGKAFGKGNYDLKNRSGVVDLDIQNFQIKPSSTTQTIKMIIGKDPARVIYTSTKFHAEIKGKITAYSLHATGTHSSIDITEGTVDKINNTNTAKLKFVYEDYTVYGKIKGSIDDPKVTVDTSALLQDKIDEKLQNKIEKALGGKAGDLLRNLKF